MIEYVTVWSWSDELLPDAYPSVRSVLQQVSPVNWGAERPSRSQLSRVRLPRSVPAERPNRNTALARAHRLARHQEVTR